MEERLASPDFYRLECPGLRYAVELAFFTGWFR